MAAIVDRNALLDLMNAVSAAVAEVLTESSDAARPLGLCHAIHSLLQGDKAPDSAVVTWACALLEMLGESISDSDPALPDPGASYYPAYRAIARLQEALGVPADKRAWQLDEEVTEADALALENARPYAVQGRSLLLLLVPLLDGHAKPPEIRHRCRALLAAVDEALRLASEALAVGSFNGHIEAAENLLHAATDAWEDAKLPSIQSDQVWGLHEGLLAVLDTAKGFTNPGKVKALREPDAFMEGKALCAAMLEAADEADRSLTEIAWRDRNPEGVTPAELQLKPVPQNVYVRPFFEALDAKPELREGFMALLSCALAFWAWSGVLPEFRALRYEDCIGGPGTVYQSEQEEDGEKKGGGEQGEGGSQAEARNSFATDCSIEVQETAQALRALVPTDVVETPCRPMLRMLDRIEHLAGAICRVCGDPSETLESVRADVD